ncbi:MAG: hypothetical protein ACNA77_10850 [Opitutales bacterium]
MNTDHIHKMQNQLDELAQQYPDEPKIGFWFARDLQEPLGYERLDDAIKKSKMDREACRTERLSSIRYK